MLYCFKPNDNKIYWVIQQCEHELWVKNIEDIKHLLVKYGKAVIQYLSEKMQFLLCPIRVAKYCNELSACLSVCSCNWKTMRQNFTKFLCILSMAMAQSFSDSIVIRYILSVLSMTSCYHTMGPIGRQMGTALCMLLAAMARSSSDGIVICYVLWSVHQNVALGLRWSLLCIIALLCFCKALIRWCRKIKHQLNLLLTFSVTFLPRIVNIH